MKAVVTVESFEELSTRKLERAAKLDARVPVPAEMRIGFDRPEEMAAFLTGSRVQVLEAAMQMPRSITDLATALRRNRSAVSRDVRALRERGMVAVKMRLNPGHGQVAIVRATAHKFQLQAEISVE